jgi:hypothetical protein
MSTLAELGEVSKALKLPRRKPQFVKPGSITHEVPEWLREQPKFSRPVPARDLARERRSASEDYQHSKRIAADLARQRRGPIPRNDVPRGNWIGASQQFG